MGGGLMGARLAMVVVLLAALWQPAAAAPLDWAVGGGHYFTQTGGGAGGYVVSDADGIPFLRELEARGGPEALGYPISRRFTWKGTTVQAFQKAVLQWLPPGQIAYLNVFDDLSATGADTWLREARSTPGHAWLDDEGKLAWEQVVKGRQAFLDANPAIKARYFSTPDYLSRYGLPASRVEDMGNHYAVRLQRAVIQQWKVDVPWAKAGQTTVANGGDIAKEAGLFPREALAPTGADEGGAAAGPAPVGSSRPLLPASLTSGDFREPPLREIARAGAARRVAIDAGHGGNQIGSVAVLPGGAPMQEKNVNLDVARRIEALLRGAGYEVTMTRTEDRLLSGPKLVDDLQARVDVANNARADVLVSVHHNGIVNRATKGTEVYYATDRPFSDESWRLAAVLYTQIGRHLTAAGYSPVPRGVRLDLSATGDGDHFYLLSPATHRVKRASLMPGAVVESLFLTNPEDAAQLARPEVRQVIAKGYATAIGAYLQGRQPWFR